MQHFMSRFFACFLISTLYPPLLLPSWLLLFERFTCIFSRLLVRSLSRYKTLSRSVVVGTALLLFLWKSCFYALSQSQYAHRRLFHNSAHLVIAKFKGHTGDSCSFSINLLLLMYCKCIVCFAPRSTKLVSFRPYDFRSYFNRNLKPTEMSLRL